MKALSSGLGSICATVAIVALPASAAAETYVPPGNSAATQYTEAVPTAGGPKATGKTGHRQNSPPAKALGSRNSRRLEEQGPQGKAAAEAAAATAPGPVAHSATPQPSETAPGSSGGGESAHGGGNGETTEQAAGTGAGRQSRATGGGASTKTAPGGSSGVGEVVGQATGSSDSGALGPLLPLAILAAVAWALVYAVRRRKRPAQ